jgi:hypothetical protein
MAYFVENFTANYGAMAKLERIIFTNNNQVGPKTLKAIVNMLNTKEEAF